VVRRGALLWLGLACGVPARAGCPATGAQLLDRVDAIEAHVRALEVEALSDQSRRLDHEIACLSALIEPDVATRVHFAQGLLAVAARDDGRVRAAAAAVRANDPGFSPDPDLVRPGSAIARAFAATPSPRDPVPLPAIAGVQWFVDGRAARGLEADRAAVLQRRSAAGLTTRYAWDGLPAGWVDLDLEAAPPVEAPWPGIPRKWIAPAGAGLGAVALLSINLGTHAAYTGHGPGVLGSGEGARVMNLVSGIGAIGLGVTAVGLAGAAARP
jgi:hypothetical protein